MDKWIRASNPKILDENWFYCENCEAIEYSYKCDCHGTSCNGGACSKHDEYDEVQFRISRGLHPFNVRGITKLRKFVEIKKYIRETLMDEGLW